MSKYWYWSIRRSDVVRQWMTMVTVVALWCTACGVRGQLFRSWTQAGGGSYANPFNWTPTGVPNADDGAGFNLSATYTVSFPENEETGVVTVSKGSVTFDLDTSGMPRTLTVPGTLTVSSITASLNVRDGTLAAGNILVEDAKLFESPNTTLNASDGTVTVTGPESRLVKNGLLSIGESGSGALLIEDGGTVLCPASFLGSEPGSSGTATVSGASSDWRVDDELIVGDSGSGSLIVSDGGNLSNASGSIAVETDGNATVTGANSTWTNSEELTIAESGIGMLLIDAGANVSNTNGIVGANALAIGTVTVSGEGSMWTNSGDLHVGQAGEGNLTIADGGSVSNGPGFVGMSNGSTGIATVTGAGSTWENDSLQVGFGGSGTLMIQGGGTVSGTNGSIALSPSAFGAVNVDGTGSKWTNSGEVRVGASGSGMLTVESGGNVTTGGGAILGATANSTGTANIGGTGSSWSIDGQLSIGLAGAGALTIDAGGTVTNGSNGFLGAQPGATSSVTVQGADTTWTIGRRLSIGGDAVSVGGGNGGEGTLLIQSGTVTVGQDIVLFPDGMLQMEGGTLNASIVTFAGGGQFDFLGGTLHVDVFDGNLTTPNGGTLAPGLSAGDTTVIGDYAQQSGATLELEIGGKATATQHDFLRVTGTASLDGDLDLSLINGFVPDPAEEFVLLHAFDLQGSFSNVDNNQRLATTDGLGSFLVHFGPASTFNPNQLVLTDFELAGQSLVAVPEPQCLACLYLALVLISSVGRSGLRGGAE